MSYCILTANDLVTCVIIGAADISSDDITSSWVDVAGGLGVIMKCWPTSCRYLAGLITKPRLPLNLWDKGVWEGSFQLLRGGGIACHGSGRGLHASGVGEGSSYVY
eukprot:11557083-Ditylum_brightwellii.AAC.1